MKRLILVLFLVLGCSEENAVAPNGGTVDSRYLYDNPPQNTYQLPGVWETRPKGGATLNNGNVLNTYGMSTGIMKSDGTRIWFDACHCPSEGIRLLYVGTIDGDEIHGYADAITVDVGGNCKIGPSTSRDNWVAVVFYRQ